MTRFRATSTQAVLWLEMWPATTRSAPAQKQTSKEESLRRLLSKVRSGMNGSQRFATSAVLLSPGNLRSYGERCALTSPKPSCATGLRPPSSLMPALPVLTQ